MVKNPNYRLTHTLKIVACLLVASQAFAGNDARHGVAMFNDFKYPPDFTHFDYVNPNAPKGGTLVLGTANDFTSFTPHLNVGLTATGTLAPGMLYDALLVRAQDELATFYGNLAETVDYADDLKTARIRLRANAHWHDGEPITARDVKFTFDHVINNSSSGGRSSLYAIESVEILGPKDVLFRFRDLAGLNRASLSNPAAYVSILPEHYWRTQDLSKTTLVPPLGSGPYRIGEFEQGRFLVWERVPDYWGRDHPAHRGRHNFDRIRYELYRDATIAREAFKKGLVDFRTETDPFLWRTGYETPAKENGLLKMRQHNLKVGAGFQSALVFNTRRDKLSDVRVRKALTMAFDFEWTNRVIYDGFYSRANSYFFGTMLAARGVPSGSELDLLSPFRNLLVEQIFKTPFTMPQTNGSGRDRSGLMRAQALFAEAGWNIRDGVMRNAAGEAFELEFLSNSAAHKRTLLPFMDQLLHLGIKSSIRLVESSQYTNRRRTYNYDAMLQYFAYGFPPSVELRAYFHSDVANMPSSGNWPGIENPVVDAMVTAVLSALTIDELMAAGRALDRTLLWGYYVIPITGIQQPKVVYWNKFGRPPVDAEYNTDFPHTWWRDEAQGLRVGEDLPGN